MSRPRPPHRVFPVSFSTVRSAPRPSIPRVRFQESIRRDGIGHELAAHQHLPRPEPCAQRVLGDEIKGERDAAGPQNERPSPGDEGASVGGLYLVDLVLGFGGAHHQLLFYRFRRASLIRRLDELVDDVGDALRRRDDAPPPMRFSKKAITRSIMLWATLPARAGSSLA